MSTQNKILLSLFAVFTVLVCAELVAYFFFFAKTASNNVKTAANKLAQSKRLCDNEKKYAPIIYSVKADQEGMAEGTLVGLVSEYTYKYKVQKIEVNCTLNNQDFKANPDICVYAYNGSKAEPLIYKFLGKPSIKYQQLVNGKATDIEKDKIRDGDMVTLTSRHDQTRGNKNYFYNYDNVLDLIITKQ